jgi:hypothetical protein
MSLDGLRGAEAPLFHVTAGIRDFFRSLPGNLHASKERCSRLSYAVRHARFGMPIRSTGYARLTFQGKTDIRTAT